jgi:hypothetical protein
LERNFGAKFAICISASVDWGCMRKMLHNFSEGRGFSVQTQCGRKTSQGRREVGCYGRVAAPMLQFFYDFDAGKHDNLMRKQNDLPATRDEKIMKSQKVLGADAAAAAVGNR